MLEQLKRYKFSIFGNYINIMMYLGSIFILLSFLFPLASSKEWTHLENDIHWIWSFSFHENYSDFANFLIGFNIFSNLLILICPVMVILNTYLSQKRKISKETYEKQIFTYSTTILFLTTNMLIVLPYLHLHTITVGYFTGDMWGYYYPNFGLTGLYLGGALISLGVLFSIKFTEIELYETLIICAFVCIYLVIPSYYDLEYLVIAFVSIILIFLVFSYCFEELTTKFLGFIIIYCLVLGLTSQDITYYMFFSLVSYFLNYQALFPLYARILPGFSRYFNSFYLPAFLFFVYLIYLYIRKKPDEFVSESKIEQPLKEPLMVKKIFYTRRLEDSIYDYLNKNKGKAFTSKTIYNRCEPIKEFDINTSDIKKIMDNLTVWGKIGSHEKEGEKFYFAHLLSRKK